jgi:hypothetical protein
LLCCVNLSVADEVASNPDVEFEPVGLDDPVTYMEMSACGEWLFLTNLTENSITFHDVREDRVVDNPESPSSGNALWRNRQLIIADNRVGTISVFAEM